MFLRSILVVAYFVGSKLVIKKQKTKKKKLSIDFNNILNFCAPVLCVHKLLFLLMHKIIFFFAQCLFVSYLDLEK